jgi:PST family polysaccharide transporter
VGIWGLTGAFSIVFANLSSEAFGSKGHPKISLIVQAINLMFIVPTLLIAIRYDFRTLYTARSLIRFQYVITAMIALRILYKFRIWETIKNVMPMLLSTAVMGVVGFVLERISGNMVWQLSGVLICVVVYFAVLLGCFPSVRKELLNTSYGQKITNIWKNIFRRK